MSPRHRPALARTAAAVAVGTLLVAGLALPSIAGVNGITPREAIPVQATTDAAEFFYEEAAILGCDVEDIVYHVHEGDTPFDEVDRSLLTVLQDDNDGGTVKFLLTGLAAGEYIFQRACDFADGKVSPAGGKRAYELAAFQYSRLLLEKVVEGPAPASTDFVVTIACSQNGTTIFTGPDVTRTFPAAGGTGVVILYPDPSTNPIQCTVEETDDGGASGVEVDPESLTYSELGDQSSTVTNTFPATDVDDTVEEAEPADPVEAEPDLTG